MAHILLIDDDEQILTMLKQALERVGHKVTTAVNGKEGIKLYKETLADVIITDIVRPEMEGLEAIRKLRKEYKDIKITAAYPLPVSNSFASRQLLEMGVEKIQGWIELEKEALINLVYFSPLPVEVYRYGRPHIFTSRANIEVEGEIADSHGVKFFVKKDAEAGLNSIYEHKVIKIPNIENTSGCFDYRNAEPGETATTDFNFSAEWV